MISNHIHYEVWDEITYSFRKLQWIEVGNGEVFSFHTLLGMWSLIIAGIKVNSGQKKGALGIGTMHHGDDVVLSLPLDDTAWQHYGHDKNVLDLVSIPQEV